MRARQELTLEPRTVADFYAATMAALDALGVTVPMVAAQWDRATLERGNA